MNKRRRARELALRALYAEEMSGTDLRTLVVDMILSLDEEEKTKEFARVLLFETAGRKKEFDDLINSRSLNWDFERIAVLDILIMRMALCEFLHFDDIPPKVSIDEAIELAKKYSTEKSGQFINGLLDGILLDLKQKGLIAKSGRGLIE
jgi:N utilization substance protein B